TAACTSGFGTPYPNTRPKASTAITSAMLTATDQRPKITSLAAAICPVLTGSANSAEMVPSVNSRAMSQVSTTPAPSNPPTEVICAAEDNRPAQFVAAAGPN